MPGNVCVVCLQDESKTCSRCHSEYYCSKECQKADWKNHKRICKQVVEAAKQVAVSSEHRRLEIANRRFFQEMNQKVRPSKYTIPPYHEEYKKVYAEREHYEYLWLIGYQTAAPMLMTISTFFGWTWKTRLILLKDGVVMYPENC